MKNSRINYVLVGAFVLAMAAVLVVVLGYLTGRGAATDTFYAVYDNVTGINRGTRVSFEGFQIGRVEKIEPVSEAGSLKFRVHLGVAEGWQIPANSLARVTSSGLLSAVAIDIKKGDASEMLTPGAAIPTGKSGNIFALMTDVASQVTDLSQNSIKPMLDTINKYVTTVGGQLEGKAPELIDSVLAIAQDLAQKTPQITANVEGFSKDLSQVFANGNREKIDQILNNANNFSGHLARMGQDLQRTQAKVDELVGGLNRTIGTGNRENLDQALKDLRYTMQSVSKSIDAITYNMEGTSRNLFEFSRQIRDNPGVIIRGNRTEEDGPRR